MIRYLRQIFVIFWGILFAINSKKIVIYIISIVNGNNDGNISIYLVLYAIFVVIYLYCTKILNNVTSKWKITAILFTMTALPRLVAVILSNDYEPTSDFLNYLKFGQYFYEGKYHLIANIVQAYSMPKMGGLAVFNGILAYLFQPTLIGMQFSNVIITSAISVFIYLLIYKINNNAAIIASILFALYPSNIISTVIPTNHHGATLTFLIALYFYQFSICKIDKNKGYFFVGLSTIFLTISNFIHPSVIVIILSISLFSLIFIIENTIQTKKIIDKKNLKITTYLIIILVVFSMMTTSIVDIMNKTGIINDKREISILFKFVLGLNQDSCGQWNQSDVEYMYRIPFEHQRGEFLKIIKDRSKDAIPLVKLMYKKTVIAWFDEDSYFWWYSSANDFKHQQSSTSNIFDHKEIISWNEFQLGMNTANYVDTLFVNIIILLSIIGVLYKNKNLKIDFNDLMMFVILGWAFVILLTEVQSRYRYPAMPSFFILAGFGIEAIKSLEKSRFNKIKNDRNIKSGNYTK